MNTVELVRSESHRIGPTRSSRRGRRCSRTSEPIAKDSWARDSSASRAKGANLPGIAAFFAAIDEVISSGSAPVTAGKACLSREESATGLSACGAGRRPPDPVPGPQHPKQALTNDTQSSRRLRHSGSKRAANVRIRLRSTMRDPIAKSPKSRMNRAIARPSSSIVVTLEPACHAGGRGFESRRSRLRNMSANQHLLLS